MSCVGPLQLHAQVAAWVPKHGIDALLVVYRVTPPTNHTMLSTHAYAPRNVHTVHSATDRAKVEHGRFSRPSM